MQPVVFKDQEGKITDVVGYRMSPAAIKKLAMSAYLKYSKKGRKKRPGVHSRVKFIRGVDGKKILSNIGRVKIGFDARIINGTKSCFLQFF